MRPSKLSRLSDENLTRILGTVNCKFYSVTESGQRWIRQADIRRRDHSRSSLLFGFRQVGSVVLSTRKHLEWLSLHSCLQTITTTTLVSLDGRSRMLGLRKRTNKYVILASYQLISESIILCQLISTRQIGVLNIYRFMYDRTRLFQIIIATDEFLYSVASAR